MESLIGAADAVVSMGGYNTVCEIISQKKPLLILPRTVPREEQAIRARVLSREGYCDYLDQRDITPSRLRERILSLLGEQRILLHENVFLPLYGARLHSKANKRRERDIWNGKRRRPPRNDPQGIPPYLGKLHKLGNSPSGVAWEFPMEIYSLRQPRESFSHDHVKKIKAGVTYVPEYILSGLKVLFRSNSRLFRKLGPKYAAMPRGRHGARACQA